MSLTTRNKAFKQTIAVDPDSENSGVAIISDDRTLLYSALRFPNLIELFQDVAKDEERKYSTRIVIEAGYLNAKSNWHNHTNTRVASRVGENTGRNHQTARLLVEMARHYKLITVEAKPLIKRWRGHDGKITKEELNLLLSKNGFQPIKRTNQDVRDAILLALVNFINNQ